MNDIKSKNVAKGTFNSVLIESDFIVLTGKNSTLSETVFHREVSKKFIQFHFCVTGSAMFIFNNGNYTLPIKNDQSLLLYNPEKDLPVNLKLDKDASFVSLIVSINKFHSFFSEDVNFVSFLTEENRDKKYYTDGFITPSMSVVLNQMLNFNLNSSIKSLYFKGKAYELLSLFFNKNEDADLEQCPFLVDVSNVAKLKKAKDIIISQMEEPPTLKELSETIGLSLKKLKEGFKQVYGNTVYGFLLDYKLEVARKLLDSGSYNVNEVGDRVGYSTASHFIAAFKKKYGTTPKKYLQSND